MKSRRALFAAGSALAMLLCFGNGAVWAGPDDVTWVRDLPAGEPAGRTGLRVPCGNYGVFHFNIAVSPASGPGPIPPPILTPQDLCANQAAGCISGREAPAYYPSIGLGVAQPVPPVQPAEPVPIDEGFEGLSAGDSFGESAEDSGARSAEDPGAKNTGDTAPTGGWSPCQGGSCFDARGVASGARPWVAVIDWDDPHGWSVGWTLREIVGFHPGPDPQHDFDLALLPFFTSALQAFSGKGVTDVHVLAKLCEISEAVDRSGIRPPSAINMSFGRHFRGAGQDWDRGTLCQSDALGCQIVRVLEHLYKPPSGPGTGTALVAAAGNYRTVQFPAAVRTVIPVGALDVDAFAAQRTATATWETAPELVADPPPQRARGLLPASGLCLEASPGQVGSPSWVAPPGSSYSAALLSGWLTLELADGTLSDSLLPELWTLKRNCPSPGSCTYYLVQGSQRQYGPHASTNVLFSRLFDPGNRPCGQPPSQGMPTVMASVPGNTVPDPTATLPSFLEVLSGWDLPSPGSNPCIPCAGLGGPPPKRFGLDATKIQVGTPQAVPMDWTIDFSESGSFVEGMVLESIYLRSATGFRKVALSTVDLAVVQSGKLNGVYLAGAGAYVTANQQASLVFVLHRGGDDGGNPKSFWTSIPVYFP